MLFNRVTATVVCFFIAHIAISQQSNEQKIKFGNITPADFKPVNYSIDTSADAVILYENGSIHFEGSTFSGYSVVYHVEKTHTLIEKKKF
jgi:hypothetical protein